MVFFIGLEVSGIYEQIYNFIMVCDIDIRRDMYSNIVLLGGFIMFLGIKDRLVKEVMVVFFSLMKVKISVVLEWKYLVWIGGFILGFLFIF